MEIDTVLVPVDGTRAAMDAVEYAIAIAERYDACVHALYLLGENAAGAMNDGSVEAEAVADRGEQVMAGVRAAAGIVPVDHSSACGFSVSRLSQHPGSVILDVAEMLDVDFIVVPREPVTGDMEAVIEKAAEYVLAYASQPVLSV
jgi:nucleotide-binding universal stress UspA family protein